MAKTQAKIKGNKKKPKLVDVTFQFESKVLDGMKELFFEFPEFAQTNMAAAEELISFMETTIVSAQELVTLGRKQIDAAKKELSKNAD